MPDRQPSDDATANAEVPEETEVPANRAARRAQGKKKSRVQPQGNVQFNSRKNPVQGQRQWSNRRSGG